MKRYILCSLAICTLFMLGSCGNSQNQNDTVKLNNNDAIEADKNDTSALDGEIFNKLPDEAYDSFNFVAEKSKKLFPDAEGEWMYGYKETKKVNDKECYIFIVYTFDDGAHVKQGTVAKSVKNDTLYLYNEDESKFEKAEIPDEDKSSWASTNTIAFVKN